MRPTRHLLAVVAVAIVLPAAPALASTESALTVSVTGDGVGVVVSDPPGIVCPGDCEEPFADGTEVELTATAEWGSALLRWSACDGAESTCTVTVGEDTTVEALFDVIVFPALCVPRFNQICGTDGADILIVDPSVDHAVTVIGGAGDDWIVGGPKGDLLKGGDGRDRIFGRGGRDTLKGGAGPDTLVGGPGADRCKS